MSVIAPRAVDHSSTTRSCARFPAATLWLTCVSCLLTTAGGDLAAQPPPQISRLAPLGVQPGTTVDVAVTGSNLQQASRLWTTFGESTERVDDAVNDKSATFRLQVSADVSPGVYAGRLETPGGATPQRLILVDDLPSVAEAGGNGSPESAQPVPASAGIDAQVDNLARDFYRVTVAAGQRLSFEVLARRIGSKLDPVLIVYNAAGDRIATVDDTPGLGGDCQLDQTFAEAGDYLIEVRDIRYAGGGEYFYRLRIGDFPCGAGVAAGRGPGDDDPT
ncbi:MAG: hypothetical protein R3B90_06405 [Planctomycetaceae bacterium]